MGRNTRSRPLASPVERRKAPRHRPVDLDAVIITGLSSRRSQRHREVRVRSISSTGIAIEVNIEDQLPFEIELGKLITLSFILPKVAKIACVEAEVVRAYRQVSEGGVVQLSENYDPLNDPAAANRDMVFGLGLRFVNLTGDMENQLQRYIQEMIEA
ncbi:MAG: PilZ domain-containing protein [bacterium]|nr:PilZ domain-containing protein [bacterium]